MDDAGTTTTGLGPRSAFVVHVDPGTVGDPAAARGRIEHVPTGLSSLFDGVAEMFGFMQSVLASAARQPLPAPHRDRRLEEGLPAGIVTDRNPARRFDP